ncbi:Lrp/AsnC family transcriptional regulator [Mumia sp. zg.B53]|uniref:Lrp/AsnC family transcriptional regulator n=1 Tax=unclassified Mumia TaxID=2621872 RepID=UPI001C6DF1D3|nr:MULTISPECIES: Lrp/AsnC family transcriptional regulator [unclassified Mumia]MBW9204757.1 Lrp/AsnC family transcriptional regulator [Mumia sp. zg.B17]MBW9209238.1 Lrp/AsnC family transcriptional regulator [Mumia sp. zg.B21]MBW9213848.1 Lrp/AsnC family transcriptional regulator [Mumia sp. zg.B53]MDD9349229.1 Lrp/AsnC family transcriptional regulator [Mumia sp.]
MDAVDREIIGHLMRDGRATYAEIGSGVGLSAPAVKRRVDLMRARGQITGFTALTDPAALGWTTEAYVEIYYDGNVSVAELKRNLAAIPQIVGAWTVAGHADAIVHVMATSMTEIEQVVERMREHARVERTRSAIVMSRLFERPRSR